MQTRILVLYCNAYDGIDFITVMHVKKNLVYLPSKEVAIESAGCSSYF